MTPPLLSGRRTKPCLTNSRSREQNRGVLTDQQQFVLQAPAVGVGGIEQAAALDVCPPRVVQVKREIAEKARGYWGSTVLADAGAKPGWRREYEQRRVA